MGEEGLQELAGMPRGAAASPRCCSAGCELKGSYTGFADRPAYADARTIADDLIRAYVDGEVDRVEMVFNSYVSPLTQQ